MKISVIGTGCVGLVTGACLADVGNTVLRLDIDAAVTDESLKRGSSLSQWTEFRSRGIGRQ